MRQLADRTGLTVGLSRALASPRLLIHDRGRVAADLACARADGAEVISDFRVLADQRELLGPVASVPTAWRTLNEIAAGGPRALGQITTAANAARRQAWAGIVAEPPGHRRRLMITVDGAGASHGLIARLDKLADRPGHQLVYSVGWDLGERERQAIRLSPRQAWQIAVDHRGHVQERRADDSCADRSCGHVPCWIEEAHVTELTAGSPRKISRSTPRGWPPP